MLEGIFPGSDNFFKYLLTIGFILLLFALVYPLKKEQEMRVQKIELEQDSARLAYDISNLKITVSDLKEMSARTHSEIQKLKDHQATSNKSDEDLEKEINNLKSKFENKRAEGLKAGESLQYKAIEFTFKAKKHEEIKGQIWEYAIFKKGFIVIGALFCLFGFLFWTGTAYVDDMVKGGHSLSGYKTSYVKCIEHFKKRWALFSLMTAIAIIILIVLVAKL